MVQPVVYDPNDSFLARSEKLHKAPCAHVWEIRGRHTHITFQIDPRVTSDMVRHRFDWWTHEEFGQLMAALRQNLGDRWIPAPSPFVIEISHDVRNCLVAIWEACTDLDLEPPFVALYKGKKQNRKLSVYQDLGDYVAGLSTP